MAENNGEIWKTLKDYRVPTIDDYTISIIGPLVQVNNFELKASLLTLIQQDQFRPHPSEDPNVHLANFL